jgi:hypothetical protein
MKQMFWRAVPLAFLAVGCSKLPEVPTGQTCTVTLTGAIQKTLNCAVTVGSDDTKVGIAINALDSACGVEFGGGVEAPPGFETKDYSGQAVTSAEFAATLPNATPAWDAALNAHDPDSNPDQGEFHVTITDTGSKVAGSNGAAVWLLAKGTFSGVMPANAKSGASGTITYTGTFTASPGGGGTALGCSPTGTTFSSSSSGSSGSSGTTGTTGSTGSNGTSGTGSTGGTGGTTGSACRATFAGGLVGSADCHATVLVDNTGPGLAIGLDNGIQDAAGQDIPGASESVFVYMGSGNQSPVAGTYTGAPPTVSAGNTLTGPSNNWYETYDGTAADTIGNFSVTLTDVGAPDATNAKYYPHPHGTYTATVPAFHAAGIADTQVTVHF